MFEGIYKALQSEFKYYQSYERRLRELTSQASESTLHQNILKFNFMKHGGTLTGKRFRLQPNQLGHGLTKASGLRHLACALVMYHVNS